ncbi:hypothetical protein Tco_0150439 [Tanacetum coccineum]
MVVLMLSYFIRVMDPNFCLGKICLGENIVVISSDKVEGSGDWNSPEFQDTANSRQKKETKAMVFYQMDTKEVRDRFMAPCFVNGLEAYDGEINLGVEENMISNEYEFIINPEEDDVEPGVIFRRSFLGMTKAITDFGAGTVTLYPDIDPFLEKTEEEEKRTSSSAGGHLTQEEEAKEAFAIRMSQNFALLEEERPIIETMAYHDKYKKILNEIWKDKVVLDGKIVKEEEEEVKRIKGEALKEKDDPGAFVFPIRLEGQLGREDMKKVDRGITMINHTQAEAIGILINVLCQVGVTTLIAKFLILDIPIDLNAPIVVGQGFLCTIGGIVNTPERLFSNFDGFCHQTFRAARSNVMRNAKSDSDDEEEYQIQRNKFGAPIYGPKPAPYLNCNNPAERSLAIQTITNPFWKISVWKKATLGIHDDEAGSSRSKHSRQHETMEEVFLPQVHHEFLLWEGCNIDSKSRYNTRLAQLLPKHVYLPYVMNWDVLNIMGCDEEIYDMLRIRLCEAESNEEIFTFVAWIRAFNINKPIYVELCHELGLYKADELEEDGFNVYFEGGLRNDGHFNAQEYWTTGYDKIQKNDLWLLSMFDARHQNGYANVAWLIARWMKRKRAGTQKESQICYGRFISKIARKCRVLTEDVVRSLSALIYCRDLDMTPLRDLIDFKGKLIPEDPQPGVPRVGIPRPPRASMQDLYDRMGRTKIRQEAIERMEYRQSYH